MKAQLLSIDLLIAGALLLGGYALLSHAAEFSFAGGEAYPQGTPCYYSLCSDGSVIEDDCPVPMPCANVFVDEEVVFYRDTGVTCLRSERRCG